MLTTQDLEMGCEVLSHWISQARAQQAAIDALANYIC